MFWRKNKDQNTTDNILISDIYKKHKLNIATSYRQWIAPIRNNNIGTKYLKQRLRGKRRVRGEGGEKK